MKGLKKLRQLALADDRIKHPTFPERFRAIRNYNDRTANGLTRCIIDYLRFTGCQAERINNTGRYIDGSKVVKDTIGRTYKIGSGKWIPGSGTKGTADISAIIAGKAVKIEIKIGRDKQSPDQIAYQQAVEKADGLYWVCHNFEEFLYQYILVLTNS